MEPYCWEGLRIPSDTLEAGVWKRTIRLRTYFNIICVRITLSLFAWIHRPVIIWVRIIKNIPSFSHLSSRQTPKYLSDPQLFLFEGLFLTIDGNYPDYRAT